MEAMLINHNFKIAGANFKQGELYVCSLDIYRDLNKAFNDHFVKNKKPGIFNSVTWLHLNDIFRRATNQADFKNLLMVRLGGIGDLIALSVIIDYFEDKTIHLVTDEKYIPLFDWFINRPKVYPAYKPLFRNFNPARFENWAKFYGEGVIEEGDSRNWYELFFEFIDEKEPELDYLRPMLRTDRISDKKSNIQSLGTGKPSILIVNKATIMMRTCYASDVIKCLPDKEKYDIFVYEKNVLKSEKLDDIIIIGRTDLSTFLLDCYDADMVISVDTGAIHFREGIGKPAIGLYNSFTPESRTKYYEYTKSYDIKSNCELQPCFLHETTDIKFCPKGNKDSFAAPCFDSKFNDELHSQLKMIFNEELTK